MQEIRVWPTASFWRSYSNHEWYSTGLVIACSSTEGTLTITTTNDCFFHVSTDHGSLQ